MAAAVEIICEVCGAKAPRQRPPRRFLNIGPVSATGFVRDCLSKLGWHSSDVSGIDICPDCWEGHDRSENFRRKTIARAKERDFAQ
jgi:hypothetical protein